MADARFFTRSGPQALSRIAELTGATLAPASDGARTIEDLAPLDAAGPQHISFLDNPKYTSQFRESRAGACFVRAKYQGQAPAGMALLFTDDPYSAYAKTAALFYPRDAHMPDISGGAQIAASAQLGEACRVDHGAVIGENARIGARCHIGANAYIAAGVVLGDECVIGANSTVSHALLGDRVIVHRGVHIGQDGFGFAPTRSGLLKVPQLGRVVIGSDVEIGSGTCIDRGAGPDTTIGDGCKIDNLVQIGHNCQIGRHVVLVAQCGIAGSTKIEDGAMVGGQVGIAGHVIIGRGAKVAGQSGVMRDVAAGETVGGSPAVPMRDWQRQTILLSQLIKRKRDEE